MQQREEILEENERLRARLRQAEDLVLALRNGDDEPSVDHLSAGDANRLRVSEVRYRRLFEAAHDGILIVDPDTRKIIDANPFMSKLLRYSLAELVGMEVFEIGLFSDVQANKDMFETLKASGQIRYENLPLQSEDGALREVEVVANSYAENGHCVIQFNIRDITERRRVETKLHERQNFLNRIFEVLPGVLYIFDLVESRVVFVNNPAAMTYSPEEFISMGAALVPHLMHPDDQQGFMEHVARILTLNVGATATFEYRMKDKEGNWRWYMSTDTVFLRDESGAVRQFIGVAPEITSQKHAELALKESEVRSRRDADEIAAIYATAPVGLCVLDNQLRYQRINSHLAQMNGISVEAHIGKTVREILPEMADELERMAVQVFATGELIVADELSGASKAEPEKLRHWTAQWAPIKDARGVITGISVAAEEITQRKNTEAALQSSEQRYRTLIDATSAVTWSCAPSGMFLKPQPQWAAFTGQSASEMLGGGHAAAFHPDDAENVRAKWKDAVARNVTYHNELRIRRHDGKWRWMRVQCVPIHKDGDVDEWFGMCVDISERKTAEQALSDSEERLRTLFDAIDEGFMEVEVEMSADGRALDWRCIALNPAFERLTGLTDVTGMLVSELMPDLEPEWAQRYAQVVNTGEAIRFELPASGLDRWFDVFLAPVGGAGSRRVAAVYNDISERKRAEIALLESEASQKFLLKFGDALRAEPSAEAMTDCALRLLFDEMQLNRCYVGIYRLAEDIGEFPHQLHDDHLPPLPAKVRLSDFPKALEVVCDRTLVIEDLVKMDGLSDSERASFVSLGMGALIVATLRKGDNTPLWAIVAVSATPRVWTPGEVSLVEEVAERTWAAVERARAQERLRIAHDTFSELIDRSPFCTYIVDADFRMVQMSEGGKKAFGILRPLIGQEFSTVVHAVWPEPFASEVIERFRHTLATGEPYKAVTNERRVDIEATEAYDWKIERIILPDGRPGVVCHFYDLSERQRQEDHIKMLMSEVNHRSKNMLSLVQAIARQTATTQPQDFIERFGERIRALSANQDLLVKSEWRAVQLDELVRSQLAHFGDSRDTRITLDGPPVMIAASASQPLAMAVHELATNAAKYGALSNESGHVAIRWNLQTDAAGQTQFAMSWIESGGPAVAKPARSGFGSTVISGMLKMSLGCDAKVDFDPTGLVWRIVCAAADLIESDALPDPRLNDGPAAKEPVLVTGHRILVVEDEALIAMDFAETLSYAGYVVIGPAKSVAQALALIAKFGCDAAVLDTNLGAETSEQVARALAQRGTPYISTSGYSREQQPEFMQTAPLLGKPVSSEMLLAAVEQCLVGSKA